jgi:AraC-like DNA-binding protein
MLYETRAARRELEPFVKSLWRLRGAAAEIEPQAVVPDGCFELIVHLGEPFVEHEVYAAEASATQSAAHAPVASPQRPAPRRQDRALLAATLRRTVVVAASGEVDVIGVRFHPARAYPFLAAAPVEVVDRVAPAVDVMARELAALPARLEPAPTETLFDVAEVALVARLRRIGNDARFDRLASALTAEDGFTMDALARAAGISLRQLERLFKSRAGVTAKTLQRVVRFHRVASRLLDDGGAPDLATLALDGGFFDQAHMSHEFRVLADVSPSRYPDRAGMLDRLFAEA